MWHGGHCKGQEAVNEARSSTVASFPGLHHFRLINVKSSNKAGACSYGNKASLIVHCSATCASPYVCIKLASFPGFFPHPLPTKEKIGKYRMEEPS